MVSQSNERDSYLFGRIFQGLDRAVEPADGSGSVSLREVDERERLHSHHGSEGEPVPRFVGVESRRNLCQGWEESQELLGLIGPTGDLGFEINPVLFTSQRPVEVLSTRSQKVQWEPDGGSTWLELSPPESLDRFESDPDAKGCPNRSRAIDESAQPNSFLAISARQPEVLESPRALEPTATENRVGGRPQSTPEVA